VETLAGGSEGCSADPQRHIGEPDHRLHGGDHPIFPSLLLSRSPSQASPYGRTDGHRKVCLYYGVPAEEQSRDLQTTLCDIFGTDYRQSDTGYHYEQIGSKEERFVSQFKYSFY